MNTEKIMRTLKGLIPHLASLRISVVCLLLLLILTAWGTVYQAEYGLYAAQVRFFYSGYFLVGGFFPLPGAQLVLWVLFFNLVASMLFRVSYRWSNIGNIITHTGFMFLLAGSFITYKYAKESYLPLDEKEVSNVSFDRRQWELAVWSDEGFGLEKKVSTVTLSQKNVGEEIDFSEFGFNAVVQNYYRNCKATMDKNQSMALVNSEGIGTLVTQRPAQDPEDNLAGAILRIKPKGQDPIHLLAFGGQISPNSFFTDGKTIMVELRKLRHPLPITIKLIDVKKEEYPGTGIARAYQSDVEVKGEGMNLKTRINMNHPLHYKEYTFYQASYNVDAQGRESSVLAVVENTGRLLPYISGTMIFGGMVIHFLLMLFGFGNRVAIETAAKQAAMQAKANNRRAAIPVDEV